MILNLHDFSYVPYVYSPIESNCQKLTINSAAMSPGFHGYNFHQNLEVNAGHQQTLVRTDNNHLLLRPVQHFQQKFTSQLGLPASMVSVTYAMMTVEQTSEWIKALCASRGYQEADVYALSFKKNKIKGNVLVRLNHEIMKFDLDIPNHNHRLYILSVIRQLFPFVDYRDVISAPTRLSHLLGHKKSKNTQNFSLLPGLPHSTQGKQGVLLHPITCGGGLTCTDWKPVQNNANKLDIRDKKPRREFGEGFKAGERKCKLYGGYDRQLLNMRPKHRRKTVRCC